MLSSGTTQKQEQLTLEWFSKSLQGHYSVLRAPSCTAFTLSRSRIATQNPRVKVIVARADLAPSLNFIAEVHHSTPSLKCIAQRSNSQPRPIAQSLKATPELRRVPFLKDQSLNRIAQRSVAKPKLPVPSLESQSQPKLRIDHSFAHIVSLSHRIASYRSLKCQECTHSRPLSA